METPHPHLAALLLKHETAAAAVAEEEARPMPDTTRLQFLKKKKLAIKDAIARFLRQHQNHKA
jgi:hypothetical protein